MTTSSLLCRRGDYRPSYGNRLQPSLNLPLGFTVVHSNNHYLFHITDIYITHTYYLLLIQVSLRQIRGCPLGAGCWWRDRERVFLVATIMDDFTITHLSFAIPAILVVLTIPSVWILATHRSRHGKLDSHSDLYEDQDGKATPESMAAYSTKRLFIGIATLLFLGTAFSFAMSIMVFIERHFWTESANLVQLGLLASWVFDLLQLVSQ